MFKTTTTKATQKTIASATIIALFFFVVPGCLSPEAVRMDIQGIRNDMGQLQKLVEQKADNTVVAEHVDQINNKIEQTTQLAEELSVWKKSVQAETINYGGAGWVVVSGATMAMIFVIGGLLLVRSFIERGSMLSLLTHAVQRSDTKTIVTIKKNLKKCVHKGSHCSRDIENLKYFVKKAGTFAEHKMLSEV